MWKVSFHQFFLFLLGFLFFASPIPFSYLCFSLFKFCVLVNMNVFVFLRRPFLKHRFLFCILWNIIVFIGAHFVGKIWMMCKKHNKNRYFSTLLIDQEARQKKNILRGSSLGRVVGLLSGPSESVGMQAPKQKMTIKIWDILWFDLDFCYTKREDSKDKQLNEK